MQPNINTHINKKDIKAMSEQGTSNAVGGASATKEDLFKEWSTDRSGWTATKEAKQLYFLSTDDLAYLQCHRLGGGIGLGPPMKCYNTTDLIEASLAKHGNEGVMKKLMARNKRETNKRRKEEQAELARKRMKTINDNASNTAGTTTATTAISKASSSVMEDSKEIKKLRSSLLKLAKKKMGFEMSGAPKHWRFEVPGTSKVTFATLMGQPNDVELTTFVKNGAYYTIQSYNCMKLFGLNSMNDADGQLTKNFKREGVSQKIGESVTVRYKPSTMEMSVSGYAEISGALYY